MCGGKLLDGAKGAAAEFSGNSIRSRQISINHAYQSYGLALLSKLVVNTGVIPAKSAYTDNRNVSETLRAQYDSPSQNE
jgi:hypothetical protein